MSIRKGIISILSVIVLNIALSGVLIRWDLTGDKRHTLHPAAKEQVRQLSEPLTVTLFLDGEMNSGFRRLRDAAYTTIQEMHRLNRNVSIRFLKEEEQPKEWQRLVDEGIEPVLVHEREQDGRSAQIYLWPFARIEYGNRNVVVQLLHQQRGLSAEENLNASVENIEYAFAEALHTLKKETVGKVAFLEGHGELDERSVYDWCRALSKYFQIDRGRIGSETDVLNDYEALIIADPQEPFSETDKYIIDQYIMQGGKVLWLLNGVRFSGDMLTDNGVTPIIATDLRLTDQLFRYGVRINPVLVQDLQCLRIPVDVSTDPTRPHYQPIAWTYAPLLLTSEQSPITHNLMQVSTTFASCMDIVGGDDGLKKEVLLATSTASAVTSAPSEVDLSDLSIMRERFTQAYLPVAVSIEGLFPSLYAHRSAPEGIKGQTEPLEQSRHTRQVVVASGNLARNEWQQEQPLPVGYDRYSKTQFSNRDFLVNAVLWLTDDSGLISLRQKSVSLRLINSQTAQRYRQTIQAVSIAAPLLILLLTGIVMIAVRRWRYTKKHN
ncbi:MAG: gliding motility-associated ABC transporter substrate-binding protein GldG [Paludibacteraceae bacterium]|nr:gliding motility-associated ABC transporter substrate-binding protein GldG [Paludibacteraceae bacterium]